MNRERGKEERGGEEKLKSSASFPFSHQQVKWSVQTGSLNKITQNVIFSGTVKGKSYCHLQIRSGAQSEQHILIPSPTCPGALKVWDWPAGKEQKHSSKSNWRTNFDSAGRQTSHTTNLLTPSLVHLREKIPASCFLLGPTQKGSSAQRPEIENRKSTEVIFLTPQMQITALAMDKNYPWGVNLLFQRESRANCVQKTSYSREKRNNTSAFFLKEGGRPSWVDSEVEASKGVPIRTKLPLKVMKCPTLMGHPDTIFFYQSLLCSHFWRGQWLKWLSSQLPHHRTWY